MNEAQRNERRRFIPACAGNTPRPALRRLNTAVHPRVRGEHFLHLAKNKTVRGSSPRARGTQCGRRAEKTSRRFIPACAGNTGPRNSRRGCRPVHPRVRGEHPVVYIGSRGQTGSSPRARGTPSRCRQGTRWWRFIPACAGNTTGLPDWCSWCSVHPRVRGEHHQRWSVARVGVGSSPRARGTHFRAVNGSCDKRFIPACAGNTRRNIASDRRDAGSSPRARGTHPQEPVRGARRRFIPACAGNTL